MVYNIVAMTVPLLIVVGSTAVIIRIVRLTNKP